MPIDTPVALDPSDVEEEGAASAPASPPVTLSSSDVEDSTPPGPVNPYANPPGTPAPAAKPAVNPNQPIVTAGGPAPQTMFQRARAYVANSPVGRSLEQSAPNLTADLGLTPTESEAARTEADFRPETPELLQYHPVLGAQEVKAGAKNLYQSVQGHNPNNEQAAVGAVQMMGGAMSVAKPAIVAAIAMNPIKSAIQYGAGVLGGMAASEVAKRMGATPNEQEFFHVAGFFIPSVLTTLAGIKTASGDFKYTHIDPITGKPTDIPVSGAKVRGPGFAGAVGRDESGGIYVGGRVGRQAVGVRFGGRMPGEAPPAEPTPEAPRPQGGPVAGQLGAETQMGTPAQPPPPPNAVAVQQDAQLNTIVETATRAAAINLRAAQVAGLAPPPPPPPKPGEAGSHQLPMPDGMQDGHLTQQTVEMAAHAIQSLPEDMRAKGTREAVGHLAGWMEKEKTIVGPDNKVVNVDSPKMAQTEAVKLINAEVDRHAEMAENAAKEQAEAQKQQQEDAKVAQQEREETVAPTKPAESSTGNAEPVQIPNTPAVKKARAALQAAPDHFPAEKLENVIRNTAMVTTPVRKALVQEEIQRRQNRQEDAAQAGMMGQPIPPGQSREELQRWADAVKNGEHPYLHVPPGNSFVPAGVDDLKKTSVKGSGAFNGTYYHPEEISPADIRKAARDKENPQAALDALKDKMKPAELAATDVEEAPATSQNPPSNEVEKPEATPEGDLIVKDLRSGNVTKIPQVEPLKGMTPLGAKEETPLKKGDKVTYTTQKGKTRPAEIAWTDGKKVRLLDKGTTISRNIGDVKRAEEATESVPAKEGDLVKYVARDGFSAGVGRLVSLRDGPYATVEKIEGPDHMGTGHVISAKKDSLEKWEPSAAKEPEAPKPSKVALIPTRDGIQMVPVEDEPELHDTGAGALVNAIYAKLEAGESLGNVTELTKLAEKHFGSTRVSGEWTPKDMFDAMEAAVNRYIVAHGKRWMEMEPVEALAEIRDFQDKLTSQGTRTEEQIKKQQFSTPPTESFVAARLAAIRPSDVVLEPSAGNGGLAAWPASVGAKVYVNEIAERRQDMLRAAGLGEPSAHNGEIINALLDRSIKPSVILMNPPFSAGALGGRNRNVYGFNHVESALQRLEPGGRLVAILGGGQANEPEGGASLTGGASGKWFEKLAKQYHIRANVRVSGKEYQKYGTSFATRLIVIDKDGPTKAMGDVVRANVDTLEEAYESLQGIARTRPELAGASGAGAGNTKGVTRSEASNGVAADSGSGGGSPGRQLSGSGSGARGTGPENGTHALAGNSGPDDTGGRVEPVAGSEAAPGPDQNPEHESNLSPAGSSPDIHPVGDAGREIRGVESPAEIEQVERTHHPEEEDSSAYVKYHPSIKGGEHPGDIVESKTMSTVSLPKLTYRPSLPESTLKNKISAVQLESVVLEGQANEHRLPGTNARATCLIGDGTGVGKGREAASILFDNWNQGRKRLVWVSQSWDLKEAAIRDLKNVGAEDLSKNLLGLDKVKAAEKIDHKGVLYTTYAMLRSGDKKGNTRGAQVEKWLRGDDDSEGGFILFDESHNLKNAVVGSGSMGRGQPSQIGVLVKKLLEDNPNLRMAPLSATAASDVMNLGYLDRLGLWGPGTAFPGGFQNFVNEIGSGGLSAMEMVARELKAQGRYVSRTLSFKGVTFDTVEAPLSKEQKDIYRTATRAWALVNEQVDNAISNITNGGARQKSRFMSQFYSTQLRFFNVLLTTLKIPAMIPKIEEDLANDKSVIITLVNTNEAAQNREKNRVMADQAEDEDEIPDYDFGPAEMLISLVHDYFPTQQYADGVSDSGAPIKIPVTDADGNPVENPAAIEARDRLETQLKRDLKMPANPLDILIQSLGGPGKVAELTGRKEYFDEASGKFVPRGDPGTARSKVNLQEMDKFQSGKKRIAVLSSAAGTGIDLHSSLHVKNQQKRSQYMLQPGWSADKQMQMFGRSHRTEEAHPPEYHGVQSDLGGEKRFLSTIAKRLESLNAIAKGQKNAGGGVDAMSKVNFESDQGRAAAKAFYDNLLRGQSVPGTNDMSGRDILRAMHVLKMDPSVGETVPEADRTNVTRLLNRLLALDPDIQNAVYDYYYDIFGAIVQQAIDNGTLDTGVRELPGDEHHVLDEKTIATDPKTGAKTVYAKVESKVRSEKLSPAGLERVLQNPEAKLYARPKDRSLIVARPAPEIVHATGTTEEAMYIATPDNGKWRKVPAHKVKSEARPVEEVFGKALADAKQGRENTEYNLKYARDVLAQPRYSDSDYYKAEVQRNEEKLEQWNKQIALMEKGANPVEQAKELWKEQYEAAPTHKATVHHMIGGAVLRWWAPIKEASPSRLEIYTALDKDSGKRFVGVQMPENKIEGLVSRISGGQSTITPETMAHDIMRNGTEYRLEGNVRVTRGRINGRSVLRLHPPSNAVETELKRLGVIYERGVQPIYYVPTTEGNDPNPVVLKRVVDAFPIQEAGGQSIAATSRPDPSATMSFMGAGYAAKGFKDIKDYALKAGPATWAELTRGVGAAGKSAKEIGREFMAVFAPGAVAAEDAQDVMGRAVGEPALRIFQASQFLDGVKDMFEKMPQSAHVDFIDRWQRGEKQEDEGLQQAQEFMQSVLDEQRAREMAAANLGRKGQQVQLSQKENYFPNRYKRAPGDLAPTSEEEQIERIGAMFRRPFEGSKTFMKQQKYTMKEAVEKGAVPLGDPVDILLRRLQEGAKYVAAKYAMENFKDLGIVVYVRQGQKVPQGFVRINDKVAKVWRPVETAAGGVLFKQSGEWVGEQDAMRMLNNYLSVDHLRNSSAGKALVNLKNMSTEMRLSFSPFHWAYITVESIASGLNTGLDQFYNQGIRHADPAKMAAGLKDVATAIASPYNAVKVGGQMRAYAKDPEGFLATPEGEKFAEQYPDFPHLQALLFHGGLRWSMPSGNRLSAGEGFEKAMANGELGKGFLKATPWLSHLLSKPLFEHYIPRAKWVFAVKMLSQKLAQYSDQIAAGKMSEDQIARDVAATTDNRFGEFNWDALWLNNTLRTGLQVGFRSATWKIGSWRGAYSAGRETFSSKAFDDRIFEHIEENATPFERAAARLPQLGMNAGWLLSMAVTTAVMGSVLGRLLSGKWPWEWAEEAKNGLPKLGNMALEAMHFRTGAVDRHGEPIRGSFPTGLRDYEHGLAAPGKYIKGSESDIVSNAVDTMVNRDFFNNYVFNPNDPLIKQFWQGLEYNLKGDFSPMGVSNFERSTGSMGERLGRASGMVGGAPKYIDESHALREALSLRAPSAPATPEQKEEWEMLRQGPPTRFEIKRAIRDRDLDWLEKVVKYQLSYTDAMKVMNDPTITPAERATLAPILARKRVDAVRSGRFRANGR